MNYMGVDWTPRPEFPGYKPVVGPPVIIPEPKRRVTSKMEAEALAMADCAIALADLDDESKKRVVAWLKAQVGE